MKQLAQDIKNRNFRNIYLLHGSESFLRKKYAEVLVSAFLPENDTINLSRFYGKKTDIAEVLSMADTMPFMSENRVIVCENTDIFTRSCDELADYIPNIPENCRIIFSEEKIDARLKHTKAVRSHGCIAEFTPLSEDGLRDFIIKKLAKEHRQITQAALDLFMERCGDDLWTVSNELEKIISYSFGKDGIRPADIEAVCPPSPEDKIFNMIDAIVASNTQKAVGLYKDLLLLRSEPMGILALLREQFRLLLHVKDLDNDGMNIREMAPVLKMRDTRIKMAYPSARRVDRKRLKRSVILCADTDERIKSGLIDPVIGVETLIIALSGSKL